MTASTLWWLLVGALVVAELTTGTFYLLMIALGAAAGALAAHSGLGTTGQLVAAALTGGITTFAWYLRKRKIALNTPTTGNRNVNLDVGETVHVTAWNADGEAEVRYRGATWSARFSGTGLPQPGVFRISALNGNQLELVPS
jgi:membrane protein implicated in regulation of membrane protease activity